MVHLIVGEKGKGKTKVLHDLANSAVAGVKGSIVYIDRNSKHMYDLHNRIRLIDASSYPIANPDQFIGFICGIISQDHDLEKLYLDGFLDCAKVSDPEDAREAVLELDEIGKQFGIDIHISFSAKESSLDETLADIAV